MVSYAQLNNMSTSKLTSAAEASEGLSGDLSGQAEEVRCASEIPPGLWYGLDADSAISRVARMAPPLDDASDAFKSGQGGLEDLVEGIEAAKEHLEGAHDLAREHSLTISSDGTVSWDPPPASIPPELHQEYHDGKSSMAQQARGIIDEALEMAVEADETAVSAFESTAGDAQQSYFDAFPGMEQDFERAQELLGKDPSEMDTEEIEELNDLLEEHSDDPMFTTELIEELGPEGLVHAAGNFGFEGAAASHVSDGDADMEARADAIEALQQNLGESLATATGEEGGLGQEFTEELMEQGAAMQSFDQLHHPMDDGELDQRGYLALAPLLEHGEYSEDFIVPVTEHMMRLDQELGDEAWGNSIYEGTNPFVVNHDAAPAMMGSGPEGANPLNSAMTALDNNPAAATEFFNGSENYADMPYVNADGESLSGVDSNVDYMLDRASAGDDSYPADQIRSGPLGNALEAGSTGLSSGADPGTERPERTQEMANVASDFIEYVGENRESFAGPDATMSDMQSNMGNITANYIEDFHQSAASHDSLGEAPDSHSGVGIDINEAHREEWLQAVGHDEGASLTVQSASEALMFDGIENMDADEQEASHYQAIAEMHGQVSGEVHRGGMTAIEEGAWTEAADNNARVDAIQHGAQTVTGIATGFTPLGPVGGLVVGEGSGFVYGEIGDVFRESPEETLDRIGQDQDILRDESTGEFTEETMEPVREAIREANPDLGDEYVEHVAHEMIEEYENALRK